MDKNIHMIVWNNKINDIKQLLQNHNIDINKKDESGMTPLHIAISRGNKDIAQLLLNADADGSIQDEEGFTSLHYTLEYNMLDIAKDIIDKTPKVLHIVDKYGNQPLWTATMNSKVPYEFIIYLLKNGADKNHKNKANASPYDLAKDFNIPEFTALFEN
jgi:ankyrin repeat protein